MQTKYHPSHYVEPRLRCKSLDIVVTIELRQTLGSPNRYRSSRGRQLSIEQRIVKLDVGVPQRVAQLRDRQNEVASPLYPPL